MIKLFFISFLFLLLNNCSLNDNSKIWKNKENKFETNKNFKKIFVEEKKDISEFNPSLKLNLSINENKTIFTCQDMLVSRPKASRE